MDDMIDKFFQDLDDEFVNIADFNEDELFDLDSDLINTQWPSWSNLLEEKGAHGCSSTSEMISIEDNSMEIIDAQHSFHGDQQVLNCNDSCSGGNTNVSIHCNGFLPSGTDSPEYKGTRLVHLLTASAEAIADGSHDLVDIILCRLKELVSPTGSTMERVAYYLFQSLHHRHHCSGHMYGSYESTKDFNYLAAFSLLNKVYPYIMFVHLTANQSILEAIPAQTEKVIHIIDFDIVEGMQWPPLMEALISGNYKIGHLKITSVNYDDEDDPSRCKDTGRRLREYANSLAIPFSFSETKVENILKKLGYNTDDNELIVGNCMWGLPHMLDQRSKQQLVEFLYGLRQLNPGILTVGTGAVGIDNQETLNFTERFSQCMINLCAVFESSEAGLSKEYGLARTVVERLFLGPMGCRPINCIQDKNEGDLVVRVMDIPVKCGFVEGDISHTSILQAKFILPGNEAGRGYALELVSNNQLLLKWNFTSLACVSAWNTIK